MGCCGSHCDATARHFDEAAARRDLERYGRSGPDVTTRLLLDFLRESAASAATLLDVGGGIGAVSLELLRAGVAKATLVDASPSYLAAAGAEAKRRELDARLNLVLGDLVAVIDRVEVADLVVLDRVVCCYPDYEGLLEKASSRCRRLLALSYPRDGFLAHAMMRVENAVRRVKGDAFRTYDHPSAGLERVIEGAGFRRCGRRATWIWVADVFEKSPAPA